MSTTETAILERIIEPDNAALPRDVARYMLALDFRAEDRQRLEELQAKDQAETLTAAEKADLERYRHVAEFLDRMRSKARETLATQNPSGASGTTDAASQARLDSLEISPGIRRSQEAFWRDLPELLITRRNHGKWVAYHGEERIGIARDGKELVRECLRRGLQDDQYYIGLVGPDDLPPWEAEMCERAHPSHFEELVAEL